MGNVPVLGSALEGIGDFIRQQRRQAHVSLRQLAELADVSNPYLSQIERGLRKPSAEVLRQIAGALQISTSAMFERAGLLQPREGSDVATAIAADPTLTERQKKLLMALYEQFQQFRGQAQGDASRPLATTE